MDSAVKS
jgi:hypothetical protein